MTLKERITELRRQGYIRDKGVISFLREQLHSPEAEIKELAARTIIEEVLGSRYSGLRLKALDTLLSLGERRHGYPSSCVGQMDFHVHSAAFDGYSTATALILEAWERGLMALAITDHNKSPFDENPEAEKAAQKLGFCFYKGSEISADFYSQLTDRLETVHILEIPATPPKTPRSHLRRYIRDFIPLGPLSLVLYPLIKKSALLYTDYCTRKQVRNMLERFTARYGSDLKVSEEDLIWLSRGDIPVPYTIALAIWQRYGEGLVRGRRMTDREGKEMTLPPLHNAQEVYEYFLANPGGGRIRKRKRPGPPPGLLGMGRQAVALDHKLILAHPNEYPVDLFEEAIEKSALVKMRDGRVFAGVFIGVEFYSHKLHGAYKEYVKQYLDWLNETHPVYRAFPLQLFPGSDTHGRYSPDRPLGMGGNYPLDKEGYRQRLQEGIRRRPEQLSPRRCEEIEEDLRRWKGLPLPAPLKRLREELKRG